MGKASNRGVTLIEIIIALAILGIITIITLSVFASGFKGITTAGKKSETMYQSQNETEDKILEGASTEASTMTVVFPGVSINVSLPGEDVSKGSLNVFVPR